MNDESKKIANPEDTPKIGLGLIALGLLCLALGIGMGLIIASQ